MRQLFNFVQQLADVYGPTRLLAYATAAITTISAIVVSVLLYVTRKEDSGEGTNAKQKKKG